MKSIRKWRKEVKRRSEKITLKAQPTGCSYGPWTIVQGRRGSKKVNDSQTARVSMEGSGGGNGFGFRFNLLYCDASTNQNQVDGKRIGPEPRSGRFNQENLGQNRERNIVQKG